VSTTSSTMTTSRPSMLASRSLMNRIAGVPPVSSEVYPASSTKSTWCRIGIARVRSARKTKLAFREATRSGSRPSKSAAISAPSSATRAAISSAER
jgi:hypothetical protein